MRRPFIIAVVVALITWIASVVANPLWRSEAAIEKSLLAATPLGSSTREVIHSLEKKGVTAHLDSVGVYKQKAGAPDQVVGVKSIRVFLGEYRSPLVTSVSAFFAFDAEGKLIDVWVWKTVDGP
ncbi:MAG: hypothetical protein NDI75_13460 [Candidatus Didemnitutus sp.]|nr:hypothetical protein [Candidatus Didemnitutus sp.]